MTSRSATTSPLLGLLGRGHVVDINKFVLEIAYVFSHLEADSHTALRIIDLHLVKKMFDLVQHEYLVAVIEDPDGHLHYVAFERKRGDPQINQESIAVPSSVDNAIFKTPTRTSLTTPSLSGLPSHRSAPVLRYPPQLMGFPGSFVRSAVQESPTNLVAALPVNSFSTQSKFRTTTATLANLPKSKGWDITPTKSMIRTAAAAFRPSPAKPPHHEPASDSLGLVPTSSPLWPLDSIYQGCHAVDLVTVLERAVHSLSDETICTLSLRNATGKRLYLQDLAVLARAIHQNEEFYGLVTTNCYWFAGTIFKIVEEYTGCSLDTTGLQNGCWWRVPVFYQPIEAQVNMALEKFKEVLARFSETVNDKRESFRKQARIAASVVTLELKLRHMEESVAERGLELAALRESARAARRACICICCSHGT